MLNRILIPELKAVQKIHFIEPKKIKLDGEAELFFMDKVTDETVRIELHFQAGQIHGKKNMSSFVSALLLSGTKNKKGSKIHEELDELGAYIDNEISMEFAFVNLFCLRKNAKKAVEILLDAIRKVEFPQHEITDCGNDMFLLCRMSMYMSLGMSGQQSTLSSACALRMHIGNPLPATRAHGYN